MFRRKQQAALAVAALLAGVGVTTSAVAVTDWSPSPSVVAQLKSGQAWAEVLPAPDGAGLIHAAIDINAPPSLVWHVMTDCAYAQRLVTTVSLCKITQADPSGAWDVREQVTRGGLFIPEIHNIFRSDYQPYSLIRFRKVGGDLKSEEGEWRLVPLNGGAGTRVIYINQISANILAPASMVRAGMKSDTPKVLMNLRRICMTQR